MNQGANRIRPGRKPKGSQLRDQRLQIRITANTKEYLDYLTEMLRNHGLSRCTMADVIEDAVKNYYLQY